MPRYVAENLTPACLRKMTRGTAHVPALAALARLFRSAEPGGTRRLRRNGALRIARISRISALSF